MGVNVAVNIERIKKDLDLLVAKGRAIEADLTIRNMGKEKVRAEYKKAGYDEKAIDLIFKNAISFKANYENWYSESLAVLRQILPQRLSDFVSHYEVPKGRKDLHWGNYVIRDALLGSQVTRSSTGAVVVDPTAAIPHMQNQLAILLAAELRFESSLFEIRQLVQADLFDSELDAAKELLRNKFLRAAGAIAGVVIEKHLAQVCADHNVIMTKKNPGIADLNEALKAPGVIDIPQWRHITLMGDYRNLCDHNKQKEPTVEQVSDLIDGADKILKTIA